MAETPAACVWLATSPKCQGVYVGSSSFVLVLGLVFAFMALMADTEKEDSDETDKANVEAIRWLEGLIYLVVVTSGGFMMASRLCAPACCSGLESVPKCCPCNCFTNMDLPYYLWFGFTLIGGLLGVVLTTTTDATNVSMRSSRLLGPILNIAAVMCAIIKLCAMCGCCCQDILPQASETSPGSVQEVLENPVIVGQPVAIEQALPGKPAKVVA